MENYFDKKDIQVYYIIYLLLIKFMPQISLYMDNETFKKVDKAAKKDNISISKWVRQKLNNSLVNEWPKGYDQLFGSIKDENFKRPGDLNFNNDIKREKL